MTHRTSKPCSHSRTMMTDLVFPGDANDHGTIFGGKVMAAIDKVASIASVRHCRLPVVTASSDNLDFRKPIKVGEAMMIEAFVTWTHRSSMEVYVKVRSENLYTGELKTTSTSFLTFVAIDEQGKPTPVPAVYPETDEEKRLFETAPQRYEQRKKSRQDHSYLEQEHESNEGGKKNEI